MSSDYTRGRKTVYNGITMRSRLEANFAATLDSVDSITWTYEPQCFADATGQYLPDFLVLNGDERDYMEVKSPTADTGAALLKMHIIRASEPTANLYVWVPTGVYPTQGWTVAGRCRVGQQCAHCSETTFHDERVTPNSTRFVIRHDPPVDPATGRAAIGGRTRKCSQAETDAFLADRPFP